MKGTVKSGISANGFKRFLESLEQYFIQKLQILINFEFVCFGSTKANKARIALSPCRCRYCKSDLVRFGLSSSLRKYVSTIYPTKGVISEILNRQVRRKASYFHSLLACRSLTFESWCAPSLYPLNLLSFLLYDLGIIFPLNIHFGSLWSQESRRSFCKPMPIATRV